MQNADLLHEVSGCIASIVAWAVARRHRTSLECCSGQSVGDRRQPHGALVGVDRRDSPRAHIASTRTTRCVGHIADEGRRIRDAASLLQNVPGPIHLELSTPGPFLVRVLRHVAHLGSVGIAEPNPARSFEGAVLAALGVVAVVRFLSKVAVVLALLELACTHVVVDTSVLHNDGQGHRLCAQKVPIRGEAELVETSHLHLELRGN
mmetsp:Transcript_160696/g.515784  ORF Transcript_160696/g.515784 Transcript_160696/m.515784 type:complete len:206 (-) Transcript_160696:424-1041(-)